MNEKQLLRKLVLERRSRLLPEEIVKKSSEIFSQVINLKDFKHSRWILCYMDFRNEVATKDFINICFSLGKHVAIPLVWSDDSGKKTLRASELIDMDSECAEGAYGILEPLPNCIRWVLPEQFDLVIVPGVAFDCNKQRMGYGAGFYDNFLKQITNDCKKIGVCFELQMLEKIPVEDHDVQMDMVITENRIIAS